MKHFGSILCFLCLGLFAQAQTVTFVPVGPVGTLNNVIARDTNPDGTRKNVIYELQSGGVYGLSGTIAFAKGTLHIRARRDATPFKRPLLLYAPSTATSLNEIIRAQGNLILNGVHLTGRDILGSSPERSIRTSADNIRVTINDCIIDDVFQAAFRVESRNTKFYVTNSYFNRLGTTARPDNGRWFDNRGFTIDSLVAENNAVYFVAQRIYRNSTNGRINYLRLNQNTFYTGGYGRGFELGQVQTMEFTNNIFFNPYYAGREISANVAAPQYWIMLDSFDKKTERWSIRNNNFHIERQYRDATPFVNNPTLKDTLGFPDKVNPKIVAALTTAGVWNTNIDEALTFNVPPPLPAQYLQKFHERIKDVEMGIDGALPWPMTGATPDAIYSQLGGANAVQRFSVPHDLRYATSARSATGGTNGQPIGSFMSTVSTIDLFVEGKVLYYPNPAGDALTVQMLENNNIQRILIFDLTGRQLIAQRPMAEVAQVDVSSLQPGLYALTLVDAQGLVSSRLFSKQ